MLWTLLSQEVSVKAHLQHLGKCLGKQRDGEPCSRPGSRLTAIALPDRMGGLCSGASCRVLVALKLRERLPQGSSGPVHGG